MTENETRLFNTITQNDSEAAKNLIQNGGINLNVKDELGYTVLHRSVIKGNLDLVTLFITHNKDLINIRDNAGRTAAHWAVFIDQSPLQKHCIDILNSLISQGANLTIQDSKGHTVLHKAALTDNLALVKLFIEHDKNLINIPDNNGQTAVYLAAFNINSSQNANSKEIVKLLIQNDANLGCVDIRK